MGCVLLYLQREGGLRTRQGGRAVRSTQAVLLQSVSQGFICETTNKRADTCDPTIEEYSSRSSMMWYLGLVCSDRCHWERKSFLDRCWFRHLWVCGLGACGLGTVDVGLWRLAVSLWDWLER